MAADDALVMVEARHLHRMSLTPIPQADLPHHRRLVEAQVTL